MMSAFTNVARRGFSTGSRFAAPSMNSAANTTANSLERSFAMYRGPMMNSMSSSSSSASESSRLTTLAQNSAAFNQISVTPATVTQQAMNMVPAQSQIGMIVMFIPLGCMIGITLVVKKLGVYDWTTYQWFEKEVIEKKLLKKLSSYGTERAQKKYAERKASMAAEAAAKEA